MWNLWILCIIILLSNRKDKSTRRCFWEILISSPLLSSISQKSKKSILEHSVDKVWKNWGKGKLPLCLCLLVVLSIMKKVRKPLLDFLLWDIQLCSKCWSEGMFPTWESRGQLCQVQDLFLMKERPDQLLSFWFVVLKILVEWNQYSIKTITLGLIRPMSRSLLRRDLFLW